jgi:hypothetical protein
MDSNRLSAVALTVDPQFYHQGEYRKPADRVGCLDGRFPIIKRTLEGHGMDGET